MFSSINCLFLLSLGFLSWTILCYFNQIEKYILNDSNYCEEIPPIDFHKMADPTTFVKPLTHNRDNYELYVNFLCIFACIYALAKITNIAEMYMAKKIHRKFSLPSIDDMAFEAEIIDDLHSRQENLIMKINKLEKQNQELKCKLIGADDKETSQPSLEESIHKIYISNRHIHLNRQVYVDQTSVKMNFQSSPEKQRENINEIWDKYLKMQNKTIKESRLPQIQIDQMAIHTPVMMSNEELQNIRGLF